MNTSFSIRTAFAIVILSLLSAFLAGAVVLGIGLSSPEPYQKFYTIISFSIGQGFMLVPLVWFLIYKKKSLIISLRLNPVSFPTMGYTVLFAFGLIILSDELDRIIQMYIPAPDYIVNLKNTMEPESIIGYLLLILGIVIIAPIGEELLFRGFLQQFLEKYWKDVTKAILVTSLFFALIHMNPYWLIQIYLLGIMLGFLCWKTGSIVPSFLLHAMNNGISMLFSFSEFSQSNLYSWNGHVAPLILVIGAALIYLGFRGINSLSIRK